jgi:hypothetical protein
MLGPVLANDRVTDRPATSVRVNKKQASQVLTYGLGVDLSQMRTEVGALRANNALLQHENQFLKGRSRAADKIDDLFRDLTLCEADRNTLKAEVANYQQNDAWAQQLHAAPRDERDYLSLFGLGRLELCKGRGGMTEEHVPVALADAHTLVSEHHVPAAVIHWSAHARAQEVNQESAAESLHRNGKVTCTRWSWMGAVGKSAPAGRAELAPTRHRSKLPSLALDQLRPLLDVRQDLVPGLRWDPA